VGACGNGPKLSSHWARANVQGSFLISGYTIYSFNMMDSKNCVCGSFGWKKNQERGATES